MRVVAESSFEFCLQTSDASETPPAQFLMYKFNLAEARRRSGLRVPTNDWEEIIRLFQNTGKNSHARLPLQQANHWQAIHIAFAMSGDVGGAKVALQKSYHAAQLAGAAEDLFTVKTYTDVLVPEFLQINNEMAEAINQDRLWDGKLPLYLADAADGYMS